MIARLQRAARKPSIMLPLGLAVAAAAALISLLVIVPAFDDGATAPPDEPGGSGGGGRPSERLLSALDSLPLYPGATVDNPPVSTGIELMTAYWVKDPPEKVMAFYVREIPKAG